MIITVDKNDLLILVSSIKPNIEIKEDSQKVYTLKLYGDFSEDGSDSWVWNKEKLTKLNEEELYELYTICKESWIDPVE